ncbi:MULTISPECIES: cation:proton antiporter [Cupriavidus]|uniref:Sodium:proton exchanger n=1 Tax=Cupriavidus taiwanensis TaxID=164546 RepID=A0A9Q7XVT3_9BURK|nr:MULTISPECIES: cation:proton antiporter [Cupriavidus]MEC3764110.1 cation:proton antiporter [Cupriavidus sp. SS-3]SPD69014.1 Sodium:proton exchanger [Cupriavidus taiwanensis]
MNGVSIFFLQAMLVVALPYLLWRGAGLRSVFPLVGVQVLAGIVLGPSVFGTLAPQGWTALFGPERLPMLSGLQWLAVTLFCFLTGLHLREGGMPAQWRATMQISLGSIAAPFALGAAAGWWMVTVGWPVAGELASPGWFACALGICTAVTALPVLGALLREMRLTGTPLGQLALRCAAVNDAWVWLFLTLVLLQHGGHDGAGAVTVAARAAAYLGLMFLAVRPALAWLLRRLAPEIELLLAIALCLVLVSAFLGELAGLHHVMGGFVAGLVWPAREAQRVRGQLEPVTVVALLPFFFLAAGLRTEISLNHPMTLWIAALSLAVAIAGKMAGVVLPARRAGLDWRDALALGTLLQTKGLVEVVVLTVLLDARIISTAAFSGLLLMALASTLLARPLTMLVARDRLP